MLVEKICVLLYYFNKQRLKKFITQNSYTALCWYNKTKSKNNFSLKNQTANNQKHLNKSSDYFIAKTNVCVWEANRLHWAGADGCSIKLFAPFFVYLIPADIRYLLRLPPFIRFFVSMTLHLRPVLINYAFSVVFEMVFDLFCCVFIWAVKFSLETR